MSRTLTELLGVKTRSAGLDNNIEQDRFDRAAYSDLLDASEQLGNLSQGQEQAGHTTFPNLLRDVWASYYKADPTLTDADRVSQSHKANRTLVEKLLQDPATEQTRVTTMLDELSAGMATLSAGEALATEIENRPELKQAMRKAEQAAQAEENGNEQAAAQLAAEAEQMMNQAARDVRRAVRAAAEKGQEKAEQVNTALGGWGLESGDLKTMPLGDRIDLVNRLTNHRMTKLADFVGRMRNLARAKQKERVKKGRDEIHSITLGNDLAHLLPSELAALGHPTRKLDFYRRYSERQLLQYDLQAKEKLGKGPMITLIDISGSMNGHPLDWAVATGLALVDTAGRQKRKAAVLAFNTQVTQEWHFDPKQKQPAQLAELGTLGVSGGTQYEPALSRALELIAGTNYQGADIVMVTDGVCDVSEDFMRQYRELKDRLHFRAYAILIGQDPTKRLSKWADEVIPVTALTDEVAGEIFGRV